MKVGIHTTIRLLLFFSLFLSSSFIPGEVYPGVPFLREEGKAVFIVSSRKPFDRDMLSGYGELLSCGAETARIRMTQSSAESLAGEGMEITRAVPAKLLAEKNCWFFSLISIIYLYSSR